MERIVRDDSFPDEIPQRLDDIIREAANRRVNLGEERSAMCGEKINDLLCGGRRLARWGGEDAGLHTQQRQMISQINRDPPVAIADRIDADPNDLAGGA